MATGYKLADGRDFSDVFTAGDAGLVTGYCTSGGTDVGRQFMSGSSGIVTGYKNPAGIDLGSLLGYDEYLSQGYVLYQLTVGSYTEYVSSGDNDYPCYHYGAEFYPGGSGYRIGSASPSGATVYATYDNNNSSSYYACCGKYVSRRFVPATAAVVNGVTWKLTSSGAAYGRPTAEWSLLKALAGQTVPVYLKF